jgi:hypothetical protein
MDVIENIELGGFHSSSTPKGGEPDLFQKLDAIVAEAGLGAAPAEEEQKTFNETLAEIQRRANALGIDLPDYTV